MILQRIGLHFKAYFRDGGVDEEDDLDYMEIEGKVEIEDRVVVRYNRSKVNSYFPFEALAQIDILDEHIQQFTEFEEKEQLQEQMRKSAITRQI